MMKTVQSQQHSQYKEEDKYEDGRSILVALKSYMFSKQLYQKYMNINSVNSVIPIKKSNTMNIFKKKEKIEKIKNSFKNEKNEKSNKNEKTENFNENSLFWVFYRVLNNEYEKEKMFQIKQNFCIKLLEQVKVNKGELKECKVKYTDFEQSLLYDKDINAETLKVLARIFRKNILYTENIKYYKFFEKEENFEKDEKELILIKKRENYYSCEKVENNKKTQILEQIEKTHYFVENVKKPINSASYYKLDEIKTIAEQLNIKLAYQNGKNKTKTELYQEISGCLLQN